MANDQKMKEEILRLMVAAPAEGLSRPALRRQLGNIDEKRFRRLFQDLLHEGQLVALSGQRFKAAQASSQVQGRVHVNTQGFGFVTLTGEQTGDPDIFIPPGMLGRSISGDLVQLQVTDTDNPKGPSGEILQVLERKHGEIVGCLVRHGQGWAIRPLRKELPPLLSLLEDDGKNILSKSQEGDWIQAVLLDEHPAGGGLCAKLSSRIAASGNVSADLNAIVKEFDIPSKYTLREEEKAAALQALDIPREDCTKLLTVTIDPVDARDYDDALSCTEGPGKNEFTVGVHIADVASYVQPKSFLDKTAQKRGFTSYLPGRTLPMLPAALANDLCSLREGLPRFAHSVFIRIERKSGRILSFRRAHTIIKVSKRLCYDDATRFFDAGEMSLPPKIQDLLSKLREVAETMRRNRQEQELFLPMEMPEIRVLCSEQPSRIIGLQRTEHNASHALVEEFMLAANQCIAEELQSKKIAGLFRNHAEPEADSMHEFSVQVAQILSRKVKPFNTRKKLVDFLKTLSNHPLQELLQMTFLRHLPRANYGLRCEGHFGLGKTNYCHFTSPIRRYPDLLIHQQLLTYDQGLKPRTAEQVLPLAQVCSALEENCDQASYAAADRMKLRFMMQQKADNPMLRLRGSIIRTAKSGVTVFLPDYSLIGFVNAWQLPKKDWRFNNKEQLWKNHNTGDSLQARMEMDFLINTTDPIRGELTLTPFFSRPKQSDAAETPTTVVHKKGRH
ncbi:MAG: ribonuclease R family protein [Lentisphaeria bacterium]